VSELSEYLGCLVPVGKLALANVIRRVQSLLPAHDAEIREQAMREQMEADCRVVCSDCRGNGARFDSKYECWMHSSWFCKADGIRAAYAKDEQERKGGAA